MKKTLTLLLAALTLMPAGAVSPEEAKAFMGRKDNSAPKSFPRQTVRESATSNSANVNFIGSLTYSWFIEDGDEGLYSFDYPSGNLVAIEKDYYLNATGGGAIVGDKYYCSTFDIVGGEYYVTNSVYDLYEKKYTYQEDGDLTTAATDMDFDPVSGMIYGCFAEKIGDSYGRVFGKMDPQTWTVTKIAQLDGFWYGIACTPDGEVYGIDPEGWFCSIDKNTGAVTRIGSTERHPNYQCSLTCHPKTGEFYWMLTEDDFSFLCTIDKSTGAATQLYKFPNSEQLIGLGIRLPEAEDGSPAALHDFSLATRTDTMTIDFSATLPTTTFDGAAASGIVDFVIFDGAKEVKRIASSYGAEVTGNFTVTSKGMHEFYAVAENSVGTGPKTKISKWIGLDTPSAPANVKATHSGTQFTIAWDAVTTGAHDGYIDSAAVTYTVFNSSGVIASNLTGTSATSTAWDTGALGVYEFQVTATSQGLTSKAGVSNRVILGNASLPYSNSFDAASQTDYLTIVDSNADGHTWDFYLDRMRCHADERAQMDDWLFSPPVKLTKGQYYEFSVDLWVVGNKYVEDFEMAVGSEASAGGMTVKLLENAHAVNDVNQKFTAGFVAPADGRYYFGVHSVTNDYMPVLYLDNMQISAAKSAAVPQRVSDFKVEPYAGGQIGAKVSFKVPVLAMNGSSLASLDKVTVNRDGREIKSFEIPSLGETLGFEDTGMYNGNHRYTVVAWSGGRSGNPAEATAFTGARAPGMPENFIGSFTQTDGEVKLSWTPPATDAFGNPLYADRIRYTILASSDDDYEGVAKNVPGSEYIYKAYEPGDEQKFKLYALYAATEGGEAETYVMSNMTPVGSPYPSPYSEPFANGTSSSLLAVDAPVLGASWDLCRDGAVSGVNSLNEDGGYINLAVKALSTDKNCTLRTGKIKVEGSASVAEFVYYAFASGASNEVELRVSDGDAWKTLTSCSKAPKEGWTRVSAPLVDYAGKTVQLEIAVAPGVSLNTPVDNIRVVEEAEVNLSIVTLSAPSKASLGESMEFRYRLTNSGSREVGEDEYKVAFYQNGAMVETVSSGTLMAGEVHDLVWSPLATVASTEEGRYHAEIHCEVDEISSDNFTEESVVAMRIPNFVRPENLTATVVGKKSISLSWDAVVGESPVPVTDDFESYEPWATKDVGDWTICDMDGLLSRQVLSTLPMPLIEGIPLAFAVYDASDPNQRPEDPLVSWIPRSGVHAMITLPNEEDAACDEWLISPVLSGNAQTVKFFAKGTSNIYEQAFEVLYSDKSTSVGDFKLIKRFDNVKGYTKFNEYSIELPEGARYMAIRHVSNSGETPYIFMVDDFTYIPGLRMVNDLVGYHVYRDGKLLNSEPVAGTRFEDNSPLCGTHVYAVSALYNKGESGISNLADATLSGVGTLFAGNAPADVKVEGNQLVVTCQEKTRVRVASVDGRHVHSGCGSVRFTLDRGIYVVKAGNRDFKIFVK